MLRGLLVALFLIFGECLPQFGDLFHDFSDFDSRVILHNDISLLKRITIRQMELTTFPKITYADCGLRIGRSCVVSSM